MENRNLSNLRDGQNFEKPKYDQWLSTVFTLLDN